MSGGRGDPLLVLLHGLGATAGVWSPLLADVGRRWAGRWIAFDVPGHGASARMWRYDNADYAAMLGPAITAEAGGGPVTLIGHSLGGTLSLTLAGGDFGFTPAAVAAIGIKIDWNEAERARFAGIAARDPRLFDTEAEARAQHARFAGLDGDDAAQLANGAIAQGDQWRAAVDLAAFAVEPPDMARLTARAACPVRLARGADDPLVTLARLREFDDHACDIPGGGHNIMVDAPDAVWSWFDGQNPLTAPQQKDQSS